MPDDSKVDANDLAAAQGPEVLKDTLLSKVDEVDRAKLDQVLGGREPRPLDYFLGVDVDDDPTCLLGRRWLCEGGSCVVVGQSGVGKSALCIQMAHEWALGRGFYGIKPKRPLRSLIIQAENDDRDVAEEVQGVMKNLQTASDKRREVGENVQVWSDDTSFDDTFVEITRALVTKYKPDLVWVDPILSYMRGNISDQQEVSAFFRGKLKPLAREHKFCWMIMHHTGKPKDQYVKGKPKQTTADMSYAGMGSSEITNFARSIILFRSTGDKTCTFTITKRRNRAGLRDHRGEPTDSIKLKWAESGICWVAMSEEEQEAEMPDELDFGAFLLCLNPKQGVWIFKKDLVANLRKNTDWTKDLCDRLVRTFISEHVRPVVDELENLEEADLLGGKIRVRKENGNPAFTRGEASGPEEGGA